MFRSIATRSSIRRISGTSPRSFLGMFGGRETMKKSLVEKQDEYKVEADSKIVFLNEENSPGYKAFDAERDLPGFDIKQWKSKIVKASDIEGTYTNEDLYLIINSTYQEVKGSTVSAADYATTSLLDLQFRFNLCKALQMKLGFDINDYTISRSHTLADLNEALQRIVAHRWSSERNPNAIVLRPEDFASLPNVYLNQELLEKEQERFFQEKLAEADQQQ